MEYLLSHDVNSNFPVLLYLIIEADNGSTHQLIPIEAVDNLSIFLAIHHLVELV